MPYQTYSGIWVPAGSDDPHLPTIIDKVGKSIMGDTIPSFDSDNDRNTAMSSLTAAQKRGAVNFVAGRGLILNDGSGDSFLMQGRMKADRHDGTVETGNGFARIPSSKCFFESAPPTVIQANSIMGPQYTATWVLNDGGGSLFRIRHADNGDLAGGAAFALSFIAVRL